MACAMTRPAVSQHLRILLDAGLVAEQRTGRERRYRLRPDGLDEVEPWLGTDTNASGRMAWQGSAGISRGRNDPFRSGWSGNLTRPPRDA